MKKNLMHCQPPLTKKHVRLHNFFQGSAADGDLDKQGRTLIPSVTAYNLHIWIKKLYSSVWGSVPRSGIRQDGMKRNAEVELNIEDIASDMEENGFSI